MIERKSEVASTSFVRDLISTTQPSVPSDVAIYCITHILAISTDIRLDESVSRTIECWPFRVHAERAADGIASEQEALRPAQDFRALQVVKARHNRAVAPFVKVVLEECRRGVPADAEVLGAHATNRNAVDKAVRAVAGHAGRKRDEVLYVVQVDIPDEVPRHGRDCERNITNALFSLRSGNPDLLDFLRGAGAGHRGQNRS